MRKITVVYVCLGPQGYGWHVRDDDDNSSIFPFDRATEEKIRPLGFNELTELWLILGEAVGGVSNLILTVTSYHDAPKSF